MLILLGQFSLNSASRNFHFIAFNGFSSELTAASSNFSHESLGLTPQQNSSSSDEPANLITAPSSFSDSLGDDRLDTAVLQREQELLRLWGELLRPGSPYARLSGDASGATSFLSSSGAATYVDADASHPEASDISSNGTLNITLNSDSSAGQPEGLKPQQQQQRQLKQKKKQQQQPPASRAPLPPHLVNCEVMVDAAYEYERFRHGRHGMEDIPWARVRERARESVRGSLPGQKQESMSQARRPLFDGKGEGQEKGRTQRGGVVEGPYPPWVVGADEENYPLTRRVQRDIWLHQHPQNCSDPSVKFLYATFVPQSKYGIGAQLSNVAGALALAVGSGRVLVLGKFERAKHRGCVKRDHGRWQCFFAPETSDACRRQAHNLMSEEQQGQTDQPLPATAAESDLEAGSNLAAESDVHSDLRLVRCRTLPKDLVWFPPVPSLWGEPWQRIPAVMEINGHMRGATKTGNKDRWWRAQAWRYLMRSPSRYLCAIINRARHAAFGPMAARQVAHAEAALADAEKLGFSASSQVSGLAQCIPLNSKSAAWVPRPLVSMHVRMGDKAREMRMAGFEAYLHLLSRVRHFDPSARTVWLSTEMQPVVEQALRIPGWNWKVTSIPRMQGKESMPAFEARIGAQRSVENAWVNLLMAAEADYFIGALGSTWSMMIDGLRCTGGKMLAGFLSTSRDRHW
ncbi:hypothetical protein CLOP_g8757 [Closterium sp. NIES-67]|nr:hypothetical protein CLOP_g8757 [Closterium sp. NIES-67]